MNPLWRLFRTHGRPEFQWGCLAVIAELGKTVIGMADIYLIGLAIDGIFTDRPFELWLLPNAWVQTTPVETLAVVSVLLCVVSLTTVLGGSVAEFSWSLFARRFTHRVRVSVLSGVIEQPLDRIEAHDTGDLVSRVIDDVATLETVASTLGGALIWIVVSICSAIAFMALLDPFLAGILLVTMPMLGLLNSSYASRIERVTERRRANRGALSSVMTNVLDGRRTIDALGVSSFATDRTERAADDYLAVSLERLEQTVTQRVVNRLFVGAWVFVVLTLSLLWPGAGNSILSPGTIVPFVLYLERLSLPVQNAVGVIDGYHESRAAADRLVELETDCSSVTTTEVTDLSGPIRADSLAYTYPQAGAPAVTDVSMTIESGETVALVGPSGGGKSTVVRLLTGLYECDDGTISVGKRTDVTAPMRRALVSSVEQEPVLFAGTIGENLTLGVDKPVADEQMQTITRVAGVHETIQSFEAGYDTYVGASGTTLSGGQRQRIAIARAIITDPSVLVFDEPLSHVDPQTRAIITERLREYCADRTTILVSHQSDVLEWVDRCFVIADGTIVRSGTHAELLEKSSHYGSIVSDGDTGCE
ncbi:ABC transporter ATP-binding protein [Halocatena halophila]|uniref:ABC transporter ATP-binding protein n=1 Tax=Halocatena halophila TaxID=2814576 RepID=UPI002ED65376